MLENEKNLKVKCYYNFTLCMVIRDVFLEKYYFIFVILNTKKIYFVF
ncbi:hypothetical protein RU98_GL000847 [Enterococcus caccae]|nr:hypothetical protein RU98_GL000847 [Enterococcus caccae]